MSDIPERFQPAIAIIEALQNEKRHLAAFIFGSVAEGTSTLDSDLDVRVIVDEDNPCTNINHPAFPGFKLDLTFRSLEQEKAHNRQMVASAERRPNLANAFIVFDKTGELAEMKQEAQAAKPLSFGEKDYQFAQFLVYHANNKVERFLESDPAASLFAMHTNLQEVLKVHYKLQARWWVSSKKLLQDLRSFDTKLAATVEALVTTSDIQEKYGHWSELVDYVLAPIGGRQPIAENNCDCETCHNDLAAFITP